MTSSSTQRPWMLQIATEVEAPNDPTRGAVIAGEDGSGPSAGPPAADEAGAAVTRSAGTVIHPAQGSSDVVGAEPDGGADADGHR